MKSRRDHRDRVMPELSRQRAIQKIDDDRVFVRVVTPGGQAVERRAGVFGRSRFDRGAGTVEQPRDVGPPFRLRPPEQPAVAVEIRGAFGGAPVAATLSMADLAAPIGLVAIALFTGYLLLGPRLRKRRRSRRSPRRDEQDEPDEDELTEEQLEEEGAPA